MIDPMSVTSQQVNSRLTWKRCNRNINETQKETIGLFNSFNWTQNSHNCYFILIQTSVICLYVKLVISQYLPLLRPAKDFYSMIYKHWFCIFKIAVNFSLRQIGNTQMVVNHEKSFWVLFYCCILWKENNLYKLFA